MTRSLFDLDVPPVDLDAECAKLPDITRRKHHSNPESEAANARVHGTKEEMCRRIYTIVREAGEYGITSKELAVELGKEIHMFSGRLSEMKAEKPPRIRATERVRDGARVLEVC